MASKARFLVILTLLGFVGCARFASRILQPRHDFQTGNFDPAIAQLQELAAKKDNDELLYLMELGTVQHTAGRYKDAIDTFLRADKLAEIKDYTSIGLEAGSVLLNDEIKSYKGEHFENLLINVYLAIDYTMLGKWDDALVECRKVNHKLDRMIAEGKLPYEHNAFAKYLAGTLFEARKEYNDAFVDYRQMLKWGVTNFPYLPPALLHVAEKLQASQELEEYRKKFPKPLYRVAKGQGEVVILLEQGKAPFKVPSPEFNLVPVFQRNTYVTRFGRVRLGGKPSAFRTETLFDIEGTAIDELKKRSGAIIAKKLAGIAAKQAAGIAVKEATDSKLLGALTSLFLHASDTADLRSWTMLPATLQVARFPVSAGRYDVTLDMVTASGAEISAARRWNGVEVKAGQIVFLNHRAIE